MKKLVSIITALSLALTAAGIGSVPVDVKADVSRAVEAHAMFKIGEDIVQDTWFVFSPNKLEAPAADSYKLNFTAYIPKDKVPGDTAIYPQLVLKTKEENSDFKMQGQIFGDGFSIENYGTKIVAQKWENDENGWKSFDYVTISEVGDYVKIVLKNMPINDGPTIWNQNTQKRENVDVASLGNVYIETQVRLLGSSNDYNADNVADVPVYFTDLTVRSGSDVVSDYGFAGNEKIGYWDCSYYQGEEYFALGKGDLVPSDFTFQTQDVTVKTTSKEYKVSSLKKAKKTFKIGAKAKGDITYSVTSKDAKKRVTVSKDGVVTVKKNTPKGTYKVKVKIKAAAEGTYKAANKTVTIKVKVK